MKRGTVLALLLGMSSAGCVRELPTPPLHELRVTAPDDWTGGELARVELDSPWWTYFGDADLSRAMGEALESNHDLRTAAARIQIALADATIAGAPLVPNVEVSLNRAQQRQNFIGFPFREVKEAF